uniref:Gag-pol polyprotein n=1 Tax=Panagrellus redivivus TaxID=6233 RepID=A0A7E4VLI0_PANRE
MHYVFGSSYSDAETNCVAITDVLMCCRRHRRMLYRGAIRTYRNEAQFVESNTPTVNFEVEPMKDEDIKKFEQELDALLRSLDPNQRVVPSPIDPSTTGTKSVVVSKETADKGDKSKEQEKPTTKKSEHESHTVGAVETPDNAFEQDSASRRRTKSNLSNMSIGSKTSANTTKQPLSLY